MGSMLGVLRLLVSFRAVHLGLKGSFWAPCLRRAKMRGRQLLVRATGTSHVTRIWGVVRLPVGC